MEQAIDLTKETAERQAAVAEATKELKESGVNSVRHVCFIINDQWCDVAAHRCVPAGSTLAEELGCCIGLGLLELIIVSEEFGCVLLAAGPCMHPSYSQHPQAFFDVFKPSRTAETDSEYVH